MVIVVYTWGIWTLVSIRGQCFTRTLGFLWRGQFTKINYVFSIQCLCGHTFRLYLEKISWIYKIVIYPPVPNPLLIKPVSGHQKVGNPQFTPVLFSVFALWRHCWITDVFAFIMRLRFRFVLVLFFFQYDYFNAVLINELDEEGKNVELGQEFILKSSEHFNNLPVNFSHSVVQVPTNTYNKGESKKTCWMLGETMFKLFDHTELGWFCWGGKPCSGSSLRSLSDVFQ